jgi:hypothetical protein
MTVENQTKKVTVNGNDVATSFSFSPMVIFDADNLDVTFVDTDGVETALSRGSGAANYSVVVSSYPGTGSITYPASGTDYLATGEKLVIKRTLTLEQLTDLENQGGFYADVVEEALDRQLMITLQQQEVLDRSLTLPVSVSGVSTELPIPSAGLAIGWNDDEDGMTNLADLGAIAVPVSIANGGTGAASASAARTALGITAANLGATATGEALFTAASAAAARSTLDAAALTVANVFTKTQTWKYGADVASVNALTLGDGNVFNITGTTAITSIGTKGIGTVVVLRFAGALTLTHHATDLYLGDAGLNITTKAGDHAILVEYAAGDWRLVSYFTVDGRAVWSYTSGPQAITAAGPLTLAHGLGVAPTRLSARLRCIDAGGEGNFAQNQEVFIPITGMTDSGFAYGVTCYADATNLNLRFGSQATPFFLLNATSGNVFNCTNVKWNLIVRAEP